MIVVPVLMINCQVSEYFAKGPVTSQATIVQIAMINAAELPVAAVAQLENRSKKFFFADMCYDFTREALKQRFVSCRRTVLPFACKYEHAN
jgi:hypothetical protein